MTNRPQSQLADRMLQDGKLTPDQYEGVLHHLSRMGGTVEEAVLESSSLSEAELLKYLAKLYGTRFVSTEKLSRAEIDPGVLQMIPRKTAEKLQVVPVMYDAASATLSVVSAQAGDSDIAKQVQLASNVPKVRVYVGRPAAVKAAIAKYYGGDIHAFSLLDRQNLETFRTLLNTYDRKLVSEESIAASLSTLERRQERVIAAQDLERAPPEPRSGVRAAPAAGAPAAPSSTVAYEAYLESLTILVSLLENSRGELRGHSSLVMRLIRKTGERIGVSPHDILAFGCAALLHDIGKTGTYHLTALNVSEYEHHRTAAQRSYLAPLRLFEAVPLGQVVEKTLQGMYERYDGSGFPDGTAGKEISLGARLLSIADTYADLTQNGRNPFRKQLSPSEACDVLAHYRNKVFDPNLVDLFRHLVLGEDVRARLLSERPVVLLVEPDPEESTVIEIRLLEQGYDVRVARTPDQALKILSTGAAELCVSDTDFNGVSGIDLLATVRGQQALAELPWIFLTRDGRREVVSRAYELGAADYCIKPVPTDVLVAKIRRLFEARAGTGLRGVSGSLTEMSLPDIVQVLAQGRKTGQLRVRSGGEVGEIHFDAGAVVNAMMGRMRGEEAFYTMCGLRQGDFVFDPSFRPTAKLITARVESLLLEGMRRLDEGSRPGGSTGTAGF